MSAKIDPAIAARVERLYYRHHLDSYMTDVMGKLDGIEMDAFIDYLETGVDFSIAEHDTDLCEAHCLALIAFKYLLDMHNDLA